MIELLHLRAFDFGRLTELKQPIGIDLVRSVDTASGAMRFCLVKLAKELAGELFGRKETASHLVVSFQAKNLEHSTGDTVIADVYLPSSPLPIDPINDPALSRFGTALLAFRKD